MISLELLRKTPLFDAMQPQEIQQVLHCLGAAETHAGKGTILLHAGDTSQRMGLVLSGRVEIVRYDAWGNVLLLDQLGPGQSFAEVYACLPQEPLMVDVVAAEAVSFLWLSVPQMLGICTAACSGHQRLLQNLLTVLASKNLHLTRKINHITPNTIRARLLSYLSYEALRQGSSAFSIPFNRQQLADYLAVERSALSSALSKMQREGLISFHKNRLVLHHTQSFC